LTDLGLLEYGAEGAMIHPLLAEFGQTVDKQEDSSVMSDLANGILSLSE
jgi:hypothetical protein